MVGFTGKREIIMLDYKREAIDEANNIDKEIIETLRAKESFRVEAGAGSGKTYSLMKVIEWLQEYRSLEYKRNGKKIACLTYTNAAVDVIKSRLPEESFITPSTIHTFAWNAIKQFQETILDLLDEMSLLPGECSINAIKKVQYTLGIKYFDKNDGCMYLGHNDILKLFSTILNNNKFQKILANRYPIILIDEYQDSNKEIIDKFVVYYISRKTGIQFGFFGDSWQTIYGNNGACGEITNENLTIIRKTVNFRSTNSVVTILNKIRPDLPQQSALNDSTGKVIVITTNKFQGQRRHDKNFTDDLPSNIAETYINTIKEKFDKNKTDNEKMKVLMLTHRILAEQQGYPSLFELLGDGLKNADDILLCYLRDTIFPLINSINKNDMIGICDILEVSNYPIQTKGDKKKWNNLKTLFSDIDNKSIMELFSIFAEKELFSFPEKISDIYKKMKNDCSESYQNGTYEQLKNVKVLEFKKAVAFISPESQFSTDHGVKGEEYDSVLFVIGRGWNLYQFDRWMPRASEQLNDQERKSFERNRNLFYVCCSRAKRNLILLITIPLEDKFKEYLENLVGTENIIEYKDYISI